MADENKIQLDVELNENSVDSSFKKVDERAAKSAKESAAVFGEYFQRQENALQDSIKRIVGNTSKETVKSARESAKVFEESFKQENQALRIKGLADLTAGLFLLKTAAEVAGKAIKETLNFVIAGEGELKLDQKFSELSKQAGVFSDVLQNQLRKSVQGLVTDTDLLLTANEAFVLLGNNARRLPEIVELARKTYAVFGGDVVANTQAITNAIASGQTRSLRQLGLIIDSQKAYKDYADAIGTVVPLLTEQQRQSALLSAVLEKGQDRFRNVSAESGKATDSFQRLKVQTTQLIDQLSILAAKTLGKTFADAADGATSYLKKIEQGVKLTNEKNTSIEGLQHQIKVYSAMIANTEDNLKKYNRVEKYFLESDTKQGIEKKKAALADYQKKLLELYRQQEDLFEQTRKNAASMGGDQVDTSSAEYLARREQLAIKIQELNNQVAQSEVQLAQEQFNRLRDGANLEALVNQQRLQAVSQYEQQKAQLEKFFHDNGAVDKASRDQGIEALETAHKNRLLQIENQYQEQKRQIFIEGETQALTFSQLFADIMVGMELQAQDTAANASKIFRNLGRTMLQTIGQGAGQAFAAFGQAVAQGENALEAFGKSLLNTMGQMAIQLGTQFILQGIAYTYAGLANGPPLIAAGAALATFGGVLSAVGGVGPRGVTGGGSAGVAGTGLDTTNPFSERFRPEDVGPETPQTAINLTINGNVLDRRQTGLEIAQILEEQFADQGLSVRGA
jgi:hypothetical protein